MFRIIRVPSALDQFFCTINPHFRWDHWTYLRLLVLVIAVAWGRRHVANLDRYLDAPYHRSRFNNFFLVARWDPEAALRQKRNLFRRRRTTSLVSAKPQGNACFHWVDAGWLAVSKLGNLHVVFSRKRTARKILGLVTDTPELSTAGLIQANEKRWAVEQFVKDTKQLRRSGLPALRCNGRLEEIHRILHRSQPSDLRLIDIDVEGVLQHRDNFDEVDRSGLQIVDEPRCWHNLLGLDIEDL
jgi:hypothetical protein